jgi:hypothetical protein
VLSTMRLRNQVLSLTRALDELTPTGESVRGEDCGPRRLKSPVSSNPGALVSSAASSREPAETRHLFDERLAVSTQLTRAHQKLDLIGERPNHGHLRPEADDADLRVEHAVVVRSQGREGGESGRPHGSRSRSRSMAVVFTPAREGRVAPEVD